jgi:hypothetical protein
MVISAWLAFFNNVPTSNAVERTGSMCAEQSSNKQRRGVPSSFIQPNPVHGIISKS